MSNSKVASVLAFERKLDPSDALFYSGNWEERKKIQQWQPITVREKSVRGTISNRSNTKNKNADPAKLDADNKKANLQTIDVAMLPNHHDTLKVRFTLRILSDVGLPSACNNAAYKEQLLKMVDSYVSTHGFNELAKRYAYNLANGRFLWRNRVGVENIEIQISERRAGEKKQTWYFNALDFSLRNFQPNDKVKTELQQLAQLIESGLKGEQYLLLEIEAYVCLGEGQEVFPSQELIPDNKSIKKGAKSKTLYHVDGIAALHSQKVGNAVRTIDTWYPNESKLGPIAVEPYGSVTSQGKAYRQPKDDFYSLFDQWVLKEQAPTVENQHYVMATLIRGGVFGESEKE